MRIILDRILLHSVKISIKLPNPQETNALICNNNTDFFKLVGSSETARVFSTSQSSQGVEDLKVRQ